MRALLFVLTLGLALGPAARAAAPGATVWPAPAFSAERLDRPGEVLRLGDALGRQPVVLNFWASWCAPCRVEAPLLRDAARRHQGRVLFVGVNVQDTRRGAERFLATFFWTFPNVQDRHGKIARSYRVSGLPTTVFVNAAGQVVRLHTGPLDAAGLEAYLALLTPAGVR
jgi:cytochrome c biogenesis protein CcmG/thiol:disulfide interchange protein DsbE